MHKFYIFVFFFLQSISQPISNYLTVSNRNDESKNIYVTFHNPQFLSLDDSQYLLENFDENADNYCVLYTSCIFDQLIAKLDANNSCDIHNQNFISRFYFSLSEGWFKSCIRFLFSRYISANIKHTESVLLYKKIFIELMSFCYDDFQNVGDYCRMFISGDDITFPLDKHEYDLILNCRKKVAGNQSFIKEKLSDLIIGDSRAILNLFISFINSCRLQYVLHNTGISIDNYDQHIDEIKTLAELQKKELELFE